jgi:cytochrome c peroxidase
VAAIVTGGAAREDVALTEAELRSVLRMSPLPQPPEEAGIPADDPRAVRLGQFLFFDARLSADGTIACATCHDPARGFTDGKPVAEGLGAGTRNTPSVWNAAYNRWFFWDGRADSLWAQALHPIEGPAEMGSSRVAVARLIHGDVALRRAYESIFGAMPALDDESRFPRAGRPVPEDPAHALHVAWTATRKEDRAAVDRVFANAGRAIAAYERQIVSRRAPFDVFVEGLREGDAAKRAAISASAQRGLQVFIGAGECRLCHSGPAFTDGEFHDVRVPPRGGGTPVDAGRYAGIPLLLADAFNARSPLVEDAAAAERIEFLANGPHNWGAFKTPSLRNVALTAPYMHQGQFATLEEVIEYYSTLRGAITLDHHDETILVPRNFTPRQAADLRAFLESLTDAAIDPALLAPPPSPVLEEASP